MRASPHGPYPLIAIRAKHPSIVRARDGCFAFLADFGNGKDLIMKSLSMLASLLIILLCSACGMPSTRLVPATRTPAQITATPTVVISVVEDLARAFILAYESEQAADYLALFSDEAIFLDNSTPFRNEVVADLVRNSGTYVNNVFKKTNFAMKLDSHFVSRDGRFVAFTGQYSNTGKAGNLATVPIVVILEVRDGKIMREDWYYDNSVFY